MREEFERWFRDKFPELCGLKRNRFSKDSKGVYEDRGVLGAWLLWRDQQKKIEEYQLVAETLDELYVKEIAKSKELQKRIDEVLAYLGNCHRKIEIEKKCIENLLKGKENEH